MRKDPLPVQCKPDFQSGIFSYEVNKLDSVASMYGLIGPSPNILATAYAAAKHGSYDSCTRESKC